MDPLTCKWIRLRGAKTHNLRHIDLDLPMGKLIVFSGVSGSGKSSIAFDTLFVEGQRRYVESLSSHVRRHLDQLKRPDIEYLEGLSPTIAIEQKTAGKNPRSTVATMTEIHDHLRVLWARLATPYCPVSGEPVTALSQESILAKVQQAYLDKKIYVLAPVVDHRKGEFDVERIQWQSHGFLRALVDGEIVLTENSWNLDPTKHHSISLLVDRLQVAQHEYRRLAESLFKAIDLGNGLCQIMDPESECLELFSTQSFSEASGISYRALEPEDFSFNSEKGMCSTCHGLGWAAVWDIERAIDPHKSMAQDCCILATSYKTVRYFNIYNNLAEIFDFNIHTPWKKLSLEAQNILLNGSEQRWIRMHFVHPDTGKTWDDRVQWPGILHEAWTRYQGYKTERAKQAMRPYLKEGVCSACHGDRLQAFARSAKLNGWTLPQFCRLSISQALAALRNLTLSPAELTIGRELLSHVTKRLEFLESVGLDYLALDRAAPTLSGGEAQRVRLSSQIGSGLVGVTYILDEPSIGLHPRDNHRLIQTLKKLSQRGSNVIVVEHDEETILSADYVVDFGPGAGRLGGKVVYSGAVKGLLQIPDSLTGAYLSGKRTFTPRKTRSPGSEKIILKEARHHNLQGFDVAIPLGLFVVVTGVSGSGKSSLITDTLLPALVNHLHQGEQPVGAHKGIEGLQHLDKVIGIDQSPIGRLPRSNPATYIKVFDDIRNFFSLLPESKARGYEPGRFSFNVKEGSCSRCHGMGYLALEMDFLSNEYILCPTCEGRQFDESTLSVAYKGKNIREVLEMSVDEAYELFQDLPSIAKKLSLLQQVGLGYLPLGQPSPQLSGGEAQRIKLARELVRPPSGKTLYILDEPTTGLHLHDVDKLLNVLHKLIDRGNSILMIEHHLEVIRQADWIIEIGPEGGDRGGKLLASGPVSKITNLDCPTGEMLRKKLSFIESTKQVALPSTPNIIIHGARQHNLKGFDVTFLHGAFNMLVGPSGSGKSSLALDTLYAAGQRKYVDCLSPYARQFVKPMPEPRVEHIEGLHPSIAVETKDTVGNHRSTVGTLTEIYDYLRLLYTRLGIPYCPVTGHRIESVDTAWVREKIRAYPKGSRLQILAPLAPSRQETTEQMIKRLNAQGFHRLRLDGVYREIDEKLQTDLLQLRTRKVRIEVVIDRIKAHETETSRLDSAIELARVQGSDVIILSSSDSGVSEPHDEWINMGFCVPSTGVSYPSPSPQLFAFNTREGACEDCKGVGLIESLDLSSISPGIESTVSDWLHDLLSPDLLKSLGDIQVLKSILRTNINQLSSQNLELLFDGDLVKTTAASSRSWKGLHTLTHLPLLMKKITKKYPHVQITLRPCPVCEGSRLNPLARHVLVDGVSLGDLATWDIPKVLAFVKGLKEKLPTEQRSQVLGEVLDQLQARLEFLMDVGLSYLELHRSAPTLSGGEAQRIRLAAQLGAGLTGILYVLDEPSTGLHACDTLRLLTALEKLKQLGNTLLVVDHHPHLLRASDRIFEMGPGASHQGGWLLHEGSHLELANLPSSPTGQFLQNPLRFKEKPILAKKNLHVRAARAFHLKNLNLDIPLGVLCAITGVSGSGKSTLLEHIILPIWQGRRRNSNIEMHRLGTLEGLGNFSHIDYIDSQPLGLTARSDVGSYIELLPKIRELYAQLPQAKALGLKPGRFSPNTKHGMCKTCHGMGYRSVELRFLPKVHLPCPACQGMRLNPVSLQITYQSLNFGQVLQKNAHELVILFEAFHPIVRRLKALIDVGLGYLPIGFEVALLSIGEGQRLKLASRLWRTRPCSLWLLDEPCKGLHPKDIEALQKTLENLLTLGHSVVCVEHQLSFISACDWVIELGPGAGIHGGKLVAQGTPKHLMKQSLGATGAQLHFFHHHAILNPTPDAMPGPESRKKPAARKKRTSKA